MSIFKTVKRMGLTRLEFSTWQLWSAGYIRDGLTSSVNLRIPGSFSIEPRMKYMAE